MTLPVYLSGGRIQGRSDDTVAGANATHSQTSYDTNEGFGHTNHLKAAQRIQASHTLIGKTVTTCTFYIGGGGGSHTGTVICELLESDGTLKAEIGTVNVSAISNSAGVITFTGGAGGEVEADDMLALRMSNPDNSAYFGLYHNTSSVDANSYWVDFVSGSWSNQTSKDLYFTATYGTTVAKDKSTITNVPVGTRYEETDTRKIFRRKHISADTAWSQTTINDGVNVQYGTNDQTSKLGQKFETSHANVGKTFTQVTIKMKRYTAGGGNASASHIIYCKVYDSSGSARATATTTYVYSTLATSYADKTFTFATPITIAANETVGFESNGGAYDVETFNFKVNSSSTESNTYMNDYRNGSWGTTFSAWEMYMILGTPASDSWVEKGTA